MITAVQFLIEEIHLRHERVDIRRRLYIDHHFVRPIGVVHVRYLVYILPRRQQEQHAQYTTEDSHAHRHTNLRAHRWFRSNHKLRTCTGTSLQAALDEIGNFHHARFQPDSRQDHHRHRHMDHQPGHLLGGPGIDEHIADKPVDHEETEARRAQKRTHNTDQPEDQSNLLVERDQQEIVVPGLPTTGDLHLLKPVVQSLPDAI